MGAAHPVEILYTRTVVSTSTQPCLNCYSETNICLPTGAVHINFHSTEPNRYKIYTVWMGVTLFLPIDLYCK